MTACTRRVALITGCGRANGIGWAIVQALVRAGVAVAISDVEPEGAEAREAGGLDTLAASIAGDGGEAIALPCDLRDANQTQSLVERTVERLGGIDILVNNAAAPHGADRAEVDDIPVEAWDQVMAINARGVFLLSKAVLPRMRMQRWGRIVNIASAIVHQPRRLRAVYQASKAAVVGFTSGLAIDVAEKGITVNAVCPGSIITDRAISTARRSGFADPQTAFAATARSIPAARHGVPEEVADMVAFLASDRAAYITGQMITIDGGGIPNYMS